MARTGWVFYDIIEDETYIMPVNPYQDNGSHNIERDTKYEVNAGMYRDSSDNDRMSTIVAFQSNGVPRFSYAGRVYDQDQLEALEAWSSKDYPINMTDDLGRSYSVLIDKFTLDSRVRSAGSPYKHEYTLSGIILEEL